MMINEICKMLNDAGLRERTAKVMGDCDTSFFNEKSRSVQNLRFVPDMYLKKILKLGVPCFCRSFGDVEELWRREGYLDVSPIITKQSSNGTPILVLEYGRYLMWDEDGYLRVYTDITGESPEICSSLPIDLEYYSSAGVSEFECVVIYATLVGSFFHLDSFRAILQNSTGLVDDFVCASLKNLGMHCRLNWKFVLRCMEMHHRLLSNTRPCHIIEDKDGGSKMNCVLGKHTLAVQSTWDGLEYPILLTINLPVPDENVDVLIPYTYIAIFSMLCALAGYHVDWNGVSDIYPLKPLKEINTNDRHTIKSLQDLIGQHLDNY